MKFIKRILFIIPVCLLAIFLTACGNSSGQSKKTYNVAVSASSKPLSYTQGGKLKGYEVEVIKQVEKKLGNVKFNITPVSQTAELLGLNSKKYDFAANGFYSNPEREKKYLIPKQNDALSLVRVYYNKKNVKKNISNLNDLSGLKVAPVNPGGGMYNLLTTWNKTSNKKINVVTSDQVPMQQLLKGVDSGKYDALIDPSNLGEQSIISGLKLSNVGTSKPVRAFPTYLLFTKSNKALSKRVDKALKELKKDGTLAKLSKKYFGENVFNYTVKEK
ncbi:transporter substrate-binding domain-containing protein [Secundilactobacillus folii]|uniref:Transporter substrate-binding domain-containing protein n=1 Tax=Secundilactobacillus folii TaxID=2678357 RepID=A0A7X3C2A7_9LACO|nr:transporter substrate-binding domain-containing protein [Secundilactobacillus folii]MTV81627.1 transporter substrate-binding domain-containing protein [Secundilactobacillus folii]